MKQPAAGAEKVRPFALRDTPSLIEQVLPVQKLSAEAYKEQMAGQGKTLTALGSYWKGRKPLILAKACVLGCLLPATDDPKRDLEIFEMLMGMDDLSLADRAKRRPRPKEILASLALARIEDYFRVTPLDTLPRSSPVDWSDPRFKRVKVAWKAGLPERDKRRLEAKMLPRAPYRERIANMYRPEETASVHDHIWKDVNTHLGTAAHSFPELIEQLGVMRFGHRPKVGDTFSGSGQIPFEAARLGCDVYASDLNPIACMLTWGAFHIVGGSLDERAQFERDRKELIDRVKAEVDALGIETDGSGWRARVFLYCVEVRCPQSGWLVPLLPSRIISKKLKTIAELVPDPDRKRYDIAIRTGVNDEDLAKATNGTVEREGRFSEAFLVHEVNGRRLKTRISTLRGDVRQDDGNVINLLRAWGTNDFTPRSDDLLQERLYCVQWMRPKGQGTKRLEYEFRTVTEADLERERIVEWHVMKHWDEWQKNGWIPQMKIEVGAPPRYQGRDLVRSRGWTHWQHIFNPRQLLFGAVINQHSSAELKFGLTKVLNKNGRLSHWHSGAAKIEDAFYNQALNPLFNYGCRGSQYAIDLLEADFKQFELPSEAKLNIKCTPAQTIDSFSDIFITDPPYGDAIKYEEILDFFIAWLRKSPPSEFADWVWDSRRSLAIQGEDENFRRDMVSAYRRMTECMPENGIQIIMFTHQSGTIWADMANIVWASGLQVTAAWYVVTETESAIRDGSNVKGTVLLVCRKRTEHDKITRDDLAWEIRDEVQAQVEVLTGLNQAARGPDRDENVFEDADIQMAGYAAALRTLTRYARIDGRDMSSEAIRPRVKNELTFVDGLIAFAVDAANQHLVPQGIETSLWQKLSGAERFYLKMLALEARGAKSLDNYQNFAKAFKVNDFYALMGNRQANRARLKTAAEFGRTGMAERSELHGSVLRAVLYAVMELGSDVATSDVIAHLTHNVPDYYGDLTQRERTIFIAEYLAQQLAGLRPEEASCARILAQAVRNQRVG